MSDRMLDSMADIWLLIPLVIAIFIGWLLGRNSAVGVSKPSSNSILNRDYFVGLDYLLNEKTDEAIESFIRALEVNSDTIPAHLALAKLFRRKGDVQRAISIHQDLLARLDLSRSDSLRIQMALSLDYDSIGLLDRAENLLKEIIKQNPPRETHRKALTLLTKLYEKEQEWAQAIETARHLNSDEMLNIRHECAHYYCELSEKLLKEKHYKEAAEYLKQGLLLDPLSVRISFLQAQVAMRQKQWKTAIRVLRKIEQQDPVFLSEAIKDLKQCYIALHDKVEYEFFLRHCIAHTPSATAILALAELIKDDQGVHAAGTFITDELKHRPSIKGFNRLIAMHIEHGSENAKDSLKTLRSLIGTLETNKPRYLCQQCGFSGRTLVWQCPSCKTWGTTKPIQGLEGE
ncbi:lipopolysaccharide assembly protein LapB [Neptunomonas antarctica]|nr:lipopolysaccharide assembly protein LapB [Neptunomonas antarctica]